MKWSILTGNVLDVLPTLPADHFHCAVTSVPYWALRDYGVDGQLGSEPTPELYVAAMVSVFREVRRVLRPDGTLWLNIGDTYNAYNGNRGRSTGSANRNHHEIMQKLPAGHGLTAKGLKAKDLVGIPWMLAFALRADGWYLRSEIIWHKPNAMVESVRDRPTRCHEQIFLLTRQPRYFYDAVAIQEKTSGTAKHRGHGQRRTSPKERLKAETGHGHDGWHGSTPDLMESRNKRTVWRVPTRSFKGAHFATFPPALVEPCIKAGTSEHGCCPTCGAPWLRQVEKERVPTRPGDASKCLAHSDGDNSSAELFKWNRPNVIGNRDPQRHVTRVQTVGWQSGCTCGLQPVPCRVLDPFAGAGTTLLVAARLLRDSLGIELNPEYARMARERIGGDSPLFAEDA